MRVGRVYEQYEEMPRYPFIEGERQGRSASRERAGSERGLGAGQWVLVANEGAMRPASFRVTTDRHGRKEEGWFVGCANKLSDGGWPKDGRGRGLMRCVMSDG
jgi:hypothetical protein